MQKFFDVILRPVREQSRLFVFLLLMSCIVIPTLCYTTGAFPKPFVWAPPIFDCYLLCLLAWLLSKVRLSWLVWLLSIVLLGGEVFSLLVYQSPYSMTVLQLILETHPREATEFLGGHGVAAKLLWATAITLAPAALSFALFRSKGQGTRSKRNEERRKRAEEGKCNLLPPAPCSLSLIFFCFVLLLSAACQGYSYYRLWQAYTADVTSRIAENKYMPLRNSPFIRFCYGHALNVVSTKELGELLQTVERTEVDSCSFRSPIVLLVVGESYNKHHSPLYNPEARQTTPNLCRFRDSGNLFVFTDAVSPFNVTSKTLRQMFSTYYPGCGRQWVDCTLFPAVFRKAGYDVYYVTNHYAGEENNKDHHGHVGGTIFNQKGLRELQYAYINPDSSRYDMGLLKYLPSADSLRQHPSLLIFHPIGQHEDYRDRYPQAYDHFTADSVENKFTDRAGRQVVAEYDNATLYNDAVLAAVLEKYAEEEMVAILLSDHGEEIYDWRNSCYRTNSDLMTPEIARYQYEVPLLFYMTNAYKERHPDVVQEVEASREKKFITSLLPYALFHLAGISHADYRPQVDLLSTEYDETYPRIIREDVDYDELMK